jgi:hypothetical protein
MSQTETAVGLVMGAAADAACALAGSTDTAGAARYLNLGVSTLEKLRVNGGGPMFIKLTDGPNGRVGYDYADLERWKAERKRRYLALEGAAPQQRRTRFAFGEQGHGARAALSEPSFRASKASAGYTWARSRRRGRPATVLSDLRTARRGGALGRELASAPSAGWLCARLLHSG